MRTRLALVALSVLAAPAAAQDSLRTYSDAFEARFHPAQPAVRYTVRVDPRDLGGYDVELDVRHGADTLRIAMPRWAPGAYRLAEFGRYLRGVTVTSGGSTVPVVREDSATWRAVVRGGRATVRYRVAFPSAAAAASPNNRNFLVARGGLLDGPMTYASVVGHTLAPAHVRFELPAGWRIATGLVPTADPRVFFAPSYDVLIDAPVLVGALREWTFEVDGVPHRVAYWPQPGAASFDTAAFVRSIRRIVETTRDVFGRLPYRDYTFLYVDGAGGGLEHLNSTTIGARSAVLARDPEAYISVTAHEFFHTWNVKRIRPAALGPFDYQRRVRTTGLWWSEGVTDYYADAIVRRAGLVDERAARETFAANIAAYLGNPAHARISPQRSSWTAWDTPAANEGYAISYYLQGALLGELLEIALRDSTERRRGLDEVMRLLFVRHGGPRGHTDEDLLRAVNDVCECDLQPLFDRHVAGAEPIPFDRYLASLGWRTVVERRPAVDSAGRPLPDRRVGVLTPAGVGSAGGAAGGRLRLSVAGPHTSWGQAGLLTGDELIAVDGRPIATLDELGAALRRAGVGDTVRVEYERAGRRHTATVPLRGYEEVHVRLEDLPQLSERQRAMRKVWLGGSKQ